MKRDELEELMVTHLYGEGSAEDRRRLEDWLQSHPQDRSDFEDLKRTSTLLDRLRTPLDVGGKVIEMHSYSPAPVRHRWGWGLAAAACFAFLFVAGYQGCVLQIGSFRVGIGKVGEPVDVREMIHQEMVANYLPELHEVQKTIDTVQTTHELMVKRQTAVEQSLLNLVAIQDLNKRQFQNALNELVDDLDQRLRPYLTSGNNPGYSLIPVANQDFR